LKGGGGATRCHNQSITNADSCTEAGCLGGGGGGVESETARDPARERESERESECARAR
jgi:hypothetical protein